MFRKLNCTREENYLVGVYVNVLRRLVSNSLSSRSCSLLDYFIWLYIVKHVRATIKSSFRFAEPLVTVLFAIIFMGERLGMFIPTGAFLIFIGVYLIARK